MAHSIVVSAWWILTTGRPYEDLGADWFSREANPQAETRRLVRRLEALGHRVLVDPAA